MSRSYRGERQNSPANPETAADRAGATNKFERAAYLEQVQENYERLIEAVLGTETTRGLEFTYPDPEHDEEEAAIAETGIGAYLTVTGSTARDNGLAVGERLFPSETVLLENVRELDARARRVARSLADGEASAIPVES